MKPNYPHARTVDQVDDYHGTPVADPYCWLEDVDSPETLEWIKQQNELTQSILEKIPRRESIKKRLTELWDFTKAWAPYKKGKWYFQERNSGLQNQNVLYVMESLTSEPRMLLDPNTLSEDGTVALTSFAISNDGNWLAYATSASGSDWLTWRVRDVKTGVSSVRQPGCRMNPVFIIPDMTRRLVAASFRIPITTRRSTFTS